MIISEDELFSKLKKMEKYRLAKYGKSKASISILNKLISMTAISSEVMNSRQGVVFTLCDDYMNIAKKLFNDK